MSRAKKNLATARDLEIIKAGMNSEFWHIICKYIENDISVTEDLLDGTTNDEEISKLPSDEYKIVIETLKMKRKYLLKLKDFPRTLLDESNVSPKIVDNYDPYRKPIDFIDK